MRKRMLAGAFACELVFMDYCPDLGYYRCDITRQWPVNGR